MFLSDLCTHLRAKFITSEGSFRRNNFPTNFSCCAEKNADSRFPDKSLLFVFLKKLNIFTNVDTDEIFRKKLKIRIKKIPWNYDESIKCDGILCLYFSCSESLSPRAWVIGTRIRFWLWRITCSSYIVTELGIYHSYLYCPCPLTKCSPD